MAGDPWQAGFNLRHNAPNKQDDLLGTVPRSEGKGVELLSPFFSEVTT